MTKDHYKKLMAVVNEQAEDEALWFIAEYITEDFLQRALRRLHAAIEGDWEMVERLNIDD